MSYQAGITAFKSGDFRLLLPDSLKNLVPEMKTGKEIIISKGVY